MNDQIIAREMRDARRQRVLYVVFGLTVVVLMVVCVGLLFAMMSQGTALVRLGATTQFIQGEPRDVAVRALETSKLMPNRTTLSEDVIFVIKQPDGSFRALLGIEPIHGCFVSWSATTRHYSGSCSTDRYDANGINVTGVSSAAGNVANMIEFPTSVENNVLFLEDRVLRRDVR